MEWFEHLLTNTADVLRLILEYLSVLCVGVGLIAVFSSRGPFGVSFVGTSLLIFYNVDH